MPKADKAKKSKKAEKTIHPNSRKASAINRENNKSEHRQKRKDERSEKDKHIWEKVCWFKGQLVEGKEKYSIMEVSSLIASYINRFQLRLDEIEQSNVLNKQLGRRGMANPAEEAAIKMVYERESASFEAGGFEAPDLTHRATVKTMHAMGDDVKELQKVKMRKFKRQQQQQQQQQHDTVTNASEMEVEDEKTCEDGDSTDTTEETEDVEEEVEEEDKEEVEAEVLEEIHQEKCVDGELVVSDV